MTKGYFKSYTHNMSRLSIVLIALAFLVGCGTQDSSNVGKPIDAKGSESGGHAGGNAPESVTYDAPKQEKTGELTLKQLSISAGLEAYPGSADAKGNVFKREDGGFKDEIEFTTTDSVEKAAEFWKKQGLDTKIVGTEATAMGATKTDAQVIVSMRSAVAGKTIVKVVSIRYPPKSPESIKEQTP
jgi:hypothetical protein